MAESDHGHGPPRGFPVTEFETRTARAQTLMARARLDALVLTTEPEFRYFTGLLTQFWQSPTRPWFVVVPATGRPIAVVPAIGAHAMALTWLDDVRAWPSPRPADEGVSVLAEALREVAGSPVPDRRTPGTRDASAHAALGLPAPARPPAWIGGDRCHPRHQGVAHSQVAGRDQEDRVRMRRRLGGIPGPARHAA